jgi:hypothetical protein
VVFGEPETPAEPEGAGADAALDIVEVLAVDEGAAGGVWAFACPKIDDTMFPKMLI